MAGLNETTTFDIVQWLYDEGRFREDAGTDERDWCDKMACAAMEIERLREVVWLYVDPFNVKPSYGPVIERCKPHA